MPHGLRSIHRKFWSFPGPAFHLWIAVSGTLLQFKCSKWYGVASSGAMLQRSRMAWTAKMARNGDIVEGTSELFGYVWLNDLPNMSSIAYTHICIIYYILYYVNILMIVKETLNIDDLALARRPVNEVWSTWHPWGVVQDWALRIQEVESPPGEKSFSEYRPEKYAESKGETQEFHKNELNIYEHVRGHNLPST